VSDALRKFDALLASLSAGESSIEALLSLLPPQSAAQLRLCAIPHEFNPRVLQALVPDLEIAAAEGRCEEFGGLSCVVAAPNGLAIHPTSRSVLFREWLRSERLEEFRQASARLVSFQNGASAAAASAEQEVQQHSHMFHLLGADQERGLAEFEELCRRARQERRLAVCSTLIRLVHEYDPVFTAAQTATLAYHEGKLAADMRQWERAELLFRRIVDSSAAAPDLIVRAHVRLGELAAEQGDLDRAIEQYGLAETRMTESSAAQTPRYHILRSLGEAYRERGDYAEAERLLVSSLGLSREANDLLASSDTYNSLGTLYWRRREIEKATAAYQTSLDHLVNAGRRFQAAQVYNNLGMIYADGADWEEAQRAYEKSLEIKREAGDTLGQARTLTNLVAVYQGQQRLEAATEACQEAIHLFEEVGHRRGLAHAKRTLGRLYLAGGERDAARKALKESVDLFERQKAGREAAMTHEELATIDAQVGIPWWTWVPVLVLITITIFLVAYVVYRQQN
jgi:tetratricopeptide (TPR) repeat protein